MNYKNKLLFNRNYGGHMGPLRFFSICLICVFSFLLLTFSEGNATTGEGCNVLIDISNSNDSGNTMVSSKGNSCCPASSNECGCCDCVDFIFDSTFSFVDLFSIFIDFGPTDFISFPDRFITPFVIEPNCSISFGNAVRIPNGPGCEEDEVCFFSPSVRVADCFTLPFCCGTYKVGYLFSIKNFEFLQFFFGGPISLIPFASFSLAQTSNDCVRVCGKSHSIAAIPQESLDALVSGFNIDTGEASNDVVNFSTVNNFSTTINFCCCECPCDDCKGCKCLCAQQECAVPKRNVGEVSLPSFNP